MLLVAAAVVKGFALWMAILWALCIGQKWWRGEAVSVAALAVFSGAVALIATLTHLGV